MKTFNASQIFSLIIAIIFCIVAPIMGYQKIGLPPVIIVGGAASIGFIFWYFTYLKNPTEPEIILPLFLLTVAALQIHLMEEYFLEFGPAMSRLFDVSWSEETFLIIFVFVGPLIYTLTALGLYYKFPLAGFFAWFIFIGPGILEFTHFIFPFLKPALEPQNIHAITATIQDSKIVDMPNYYYKTTGNFYFPGMWTAILPMIPGIYAIFRLLKAHRLKTKKSHE